MKVITANRIIAYSLRVLCGICALATSSVWASFVPWELNQDQLIQEVGSASRTYTDEGYSNSAYRFDNNRPPTPSPLTAITGSTSFLGSAMASGPSGQGTTTVTFGSNWSFVAGTGIYANIAFQTPAAFSNFSFTGDGTSVSLTAPVTSLWSLSFGGSSYSFDLLSLTDGHVEQGSMGFTGTGLLHATGYDDTLGTFGLTGSGNDFMYTLSFATLTAVPETPGLMPVTFLAVSAILLEVWRRWRATA
jgi:hypothetical protein